MLPTAWLRQRAASPHSPRSASLEGRSRLEAASSACGHKSGLLGLARSCVNRRPACAALHGACAGELAFTRLIIIVSWLCLLVGCFSLACVLAPWKLCPPPSPTSSYATSPPVSLFAIWIWHLSGSLFIATSPPVFGFLCLRFGFWIFFDSLFIYFATWVFPAVFTIFVYYPYWTLEIVMGHCQAFLIVVQPA